MFIKMSTPLWALMIHQLGAKQLTNVSSVQHQLLKQYANLHLTEIRCKTELGPTENSNIQTILQLQRHILQYRDTQN